MTREEAIERFNGIINAMSMTLFLSHLRTIQEHTFVRGEKGKQNEYKQMEL